MSIPLISSPLSSFLAYLCHPEISMLLLSEDSSCLFLSSEKFLSMRSVSLPHVFILWNQSPALTLNSLAGPRMQRDLPDPNHLPTLPLPSVYNQEHLIANFWTSPKMNYLPGLPPIKFFWDLSHPLPYTLNPANLWGQLSLDWLFNNDNNKKSSIQSL